MTALSVLFYCFISITAIQLVYYFIFFNFFSIQKPVASKLKNVPVSVIICAKNEADNLIEKLPYILNQNYSNFEIVLVNDSSWDNTLEVMESFKTKFDNIQIVDVKTTEQFWGNKKYALTLGIKAAKHDFLLFTDADCKPVSEHWITEMSSHFSNSKSLVLGYGGYKRTKFTFLNKLIRFETLMTAIQYFAYAKLGMPYMGVGRNLAYRKELFFNNSGFMNHMDIKSGDDDLFVNEIAKSKNTAICFSKDSFTISEPKSSFKDWFIQKRRHVSTAKHYKLNHKLVLGLFYFIQFSFWVLAIVLLSIMFQWKVVLALVLFRCIIQLLNISYASRKLETTDLILLAPFLEVFLISIQFFIFSANLISKPNHWK